ncbi:MAG: 6,7-dimethyl-8-ribityllumazine synthase [Rhodospirillales bacterium]|nr:6,7-dimethyl-8-ribityllumazine synthase [Alphaproteobacteria bacterium]USO03460.1 MAG: 6,7-dimethyl-8-ribityllumazine synthase [Rhodospirillales bacterium]
MSQQPNADFKEAPHIMVIEARFYEDVSDKLAEGALAALEKAGATYERYAVPGALEIPAAIGFAVRGLDFYTARKRFDAYVALGCVIRGETSHYDTVSEESARGLMDLSIRHTLCIGNGILTCENKAQAMVRADPEQKDKGGDAARAALEMLSLKSRFGIYPRS